MIKGNKRFYQFKAYLYLGPLLIQLFSKASVLQINFLSKLPEVLVNLLSLISLHLERPNLSGLSSCAAEQKEWMGASVEEERVVNGAQAG